jgi:hypothetical protein
MEEYRKNNKDNPYAYAFGYPYEDNYIHNENKIFNKYK